MTPIFSITYYGCICNLHNTFTIRLFQKRIVYLIEVFILVFLHIWHLLSSFHIPSSIMWSANWGQIFHVHILKSSASITMPSYHIETSTYGKKHETSGVYSYITTLSINCYAADKRKVLPSSVFFVAWVLSNMFVHRQVFLSQLTDNCQITYIVHKANFRSAQLTEFSFMIHLH